MKLCANKVPVEELIFLYKVKHMTPQEIANKVGYKRAETVTHKLKRAGIWTSATVDKGKIRALHKAGWSIEKISMETEVSEDMIREILSLEVDNGKKV